MDSLSLLREELKKFSGFRFPQEVKSTVNVINSSPKKEIEKIPIASAAHPIIQSITVILEQKKLPASNANLISICLDCILSGVFVSSALISILKSIESSSNGLNTDASLKLIQFCAMALSKYSTNLNVIKSLISIVLNYFSNSNSQISNAAFAAFQQMLTNEIIFINSNSYTKLNEFQQAGLSSAIKNGLSSKFKDPLQVIGFLIINDISNLISKQKSLWLRTSDIPQDMLLNTMEYIILTHSNFIKTNVNILKCVTTAMSSDNIPKTKLSIYVTFAKNYLDVSPDIICSLFTKYLEFLSPSDEMVLHSIVFFRSLLFQNPTFLIHLYNYNRSLVIRLFEQLNEYSDATLKESVEIRLLPIKAMKNETILIAGALEISILAVQSLNSENLPPNMISSIWRLLLISIIKSIRYCDRPSCEIVFNAFSILMTVCEDDRSVFIRILCSLVSSQRILRSEPDPVELISNSQLHTNKAGLWFKTKRAFAYQLLVKHVQTDTVWFSRHWQRVIQSLSLFEGAKLDPSFSVHVEDLSSLCAVLSVTSSFSIKLLSEVLVENSRRFNEIWDSSSKQLPNAFMKPETTDAVLELLENISNKLVNSYTIDKILKLLSDCSEIQTNPTPKNSVLLHILAIIKHHSNIIKQWNYILSAATPVDDAICLQSSLQILLSVCSDHFEKLNEKEMDLTVNRIFDFARQPTDLNVSLTALGLLWNVIPFVHNKTNFWIKIFEGMMSLFGNQRSDVSSCAISTFFALLSSNIQRIPSELFTFLLDNCFGPLLNDFKQFSNYGVIESALCGMCHLGCSFWSQFESLPQFEMVFWPLLIQRQYAFFVECLDQEINSNGFLFFEEVFQSKNISSNIRVSTLRMLSESVSMFLSREPQTSLVLSGLCRVIHMILPDQKEYFDNPDVIPLWCGIVRMMVLNLTSEKFLNTSSQKCVLALVMVIDENNSSQIVRALAEMAIECPYKYMVDCIVGSLCDSFKKYPSPSFVESSFPLLKSDNSLPLLKLFMRDDSSYFTVLVNASQIATFAFGNLSEFLVKMVTKVNEKDQLYFVTKFQSNEKIMIECWEKFCDPNSEQFDQGFFDTCFQTILNSIVNFLEEESLVSLLFFEKAEVAEKNYGKLKNCRHWHIFRATGTLVTLTVHKNPEINQIAHRILQKISTDIASFTQ